MRRRTEEGDGKGYDLRTRAGRAERKRDLRRAGREAVLPDDRRCPVCGTVKVRSAQWVVVRRFDALRKYRDARWSSGPVLAMCLSCWRRR